MGQDAVRVTGTFKLTFCASPEEVPATPPVEERRPEEKASEPIPKQCFNYMFKENIQAVIYMGKVT